MKPSNIILGGLFILLFPGCYAEKLVDWYELKPVERQGEPEAAKDTVRYVFFPQVRLVPIAGWASMLENSLGLSAGEVPPQIDVAEQPPATEFPSQVIVVEQPPASEYPQQVTADRSVDQIQVIQIVPNPVVIPQTVSSGASTVTTTDGNNMQRTSGVQRTSDDRRSNAASSQSAAQNNSRSTGATRSGGR
jgi:hypothetical protein